MANIEIRRAHALGREKAREAVQAVAEQLQADLRARHRWQGDSLRFECPGAHGRIDVTENEVRVVVTLSWLLAAARGRIERSVGEYLDRYLA